MLTGMQRHYTLEQYKELKLKMLKRDFFIHPTEEEIAHMQSLPSEMSVDRYMRTLLKKYFEKER